MELQNVVIKKDCRLVAACEGYRVSGLGKFVFGWRYEMCGLGNYGASL